MEQKESQGMSRRSALGLLSTTGVAAFIGASLGLPARAAAQSSTSGAAPHEGVQGAYRFRVGRFECIALSDGLFETPDIIGVNVSQEEREAFANTYFVPAEPRPRQITTLLVNTGQNVVMLDAGLGRISPTSGKLLAHLAAAGVDKNDVDTVLLSHAHGDHIVGLLSDGGLSFPNARHVMGETEFNFWSNSPDLSGLRIPAPFRQRLLLGVNTVLPAIQPVTELIAPDTEVVPGIRALATPGHTPGHMSFMIESDGEALLYMADAIIDEVAGTERPEWVLGIDYDEAQTIATRLSVLDMASADNLLVTGYHFSWPNLGRIIREGDKYRYLPAPWQWES